MRIPCFWKRILVVTIIMSMMLTMAVGAVDSGSDAGAGPLNLARQEGATYSANSNSNPNFPASGAFDGIGMENPSNPAQGIRWDSRQIEPPYFLQVDFGKSVTFNQIVLSSANKGMKDYKFQYQEEDDGEWTDIVIDEYPSIGKFEKVTFDFDAITGKALKLLITETNELAVYGADVAELEVYHTVPFTVTFDVDGEQTKKTAFIGEAITPEDPEKEDWYFTGWYTAATGGEKVTEFTSTQTVYAQWSAQAIDDGSIAEAKALLDELVLNGNNSASEICSRLNLPTQLGKDVQISWSSELESAVDPASGRVTMGAAEQAVTLTATLSKWSFSDTKEFELTVLADSEENTMRAWYTAMDGSNGIVELFDDQLSYLRADHAKLGGAGLAVHFIEGFEIKGSYVRGWNNTAQSFSWDVYNEQEGDYLLEAMMSAPKDAVIEITAGESKLEYTVTTSDLWGNWDRFALGALHLPAGKSTITLRAAQTPGAEMVLKALELKPAAAAESIAQAVVDSSSKATWMQGAMGVFFQWGTWGCNTDGKEMPWPQSYEELDYEKFAKTMKDMGADYVVWSPSWWQYWLPAPIAAVDDVMPGRTTTNFGGEDYLMQLIDALDAEGIGMVFYYHAGHDAHYDSSSNNNTPWWKAFWDGPKDGHYARKENAMTDFVNIMTEVGERYGDKLDGWLFDDASIYYPAPYDVLDKAVRAGNPDRLISWNSWTDWQGPRLTEYEDYSFCNAMDDGQSWDSVIDAETGRFASGKWEGDIANFMFNVENGGWGIVAGRTAPLACTWSQERMTQAIAKAKQKNKSLLFSINMWANGDLCQDTITRFTAAMEDAGYRIPTGEMNNNSRDIVYSGEDWQWEKNRNLGDMAGDVHTTSRNGDAFSYTFSGSGIEYITELGPEMGEVEIYLDDELQTVLDLNATQRQTAQTVYSSSSLPDGTHTLKCVKRSGDAMRLDALRVFSDLKNDNEEDITYSGAWTHSSNRDFGDYQRDVHYTATNGSSFTYTFVGTGVEYITELEPSQGEVDIYIDDEPAETVTTYTDGARQSQVAVYRRDDLEYGEHTIKGVKKTGQYMLVDALRVLGQVRNMGEYAVSIHGGSGGGEYRAGSEVVVTADTSGARFTGWEALGVQLTQEQALQPELKFTMPSNVVTLRARFAGSSSASTPNSSSDTTTKTENNGDGSTSTITTNKKTGTVVETAKYPDGSKVVTTTTKDGASHAVVTVPKAGEKTTVTIPTAEKPAAGTVAVIVKADGTKEVVKTSVATAAGMRVTLTDGATIELIDNTKTFTDVKSGDWHKDAVTFATSRELFNGTSTNSFAPTAPMTRAMLMTVLYRYEGASVKGTGDRWYADSMAWAKEIELSDGTNPDDNITREQLATMLYRYAKPTDTVKGDVSKFADGSKVSDFAVEAMNWAIGIGLISGKGNNLLDPQADATRAEVATMLMPLLASFS